MDHRYVCMVLCDTLLDSLYIYTNIAITISRCSFKSFFSWKPILSAYREKVSVKSRLLSPCSMNGYIPTSTSR